MGLRRIDSQAASQSPRACVRVLLRNRSRRGWLLSSGPVSPITQWPLLRLGSRSHNLLPFYTLVTADVAFFFCSTIILDVEVNTRLALHHFAPAGRGKKAKKERGRENNYPNVCSELLSYLTARKPLNLTTNSNSNPNSSATILV